MRDCRCVVVAMVVAAGSARALAQFEGFTSLSAGPIGLRLLTPTNISGDGTTVVGYAYSFDTFSIFRPVRFTASGGVQDLGLYPGETRARAYSTNSNGAFVVGGGDSLGFWWVPPGPNVSSGTAPLLDVNDDGSVFITSTTRYAGLDTPADFPNLPAYTSLLARRLSGDGESAALTCHFFQAGNGYGYPPTPDINIDQASRWTAGGGTQGLGFLPTGKNSVALGISADGAVVVGSADVQVSPGNFRMRPFRWSQSGGMQAIPMIAGDSNFGEATDASANGSVIVGNSDSKAFVWDAAHGTRSIQTLLTSHGHDLMGWTLFRVDGISDDGTIATGNAFDSQGNSSGWVANLVDTCTSPGSVGAVTLGIVAREGTSAPGTDQTFGSQFNANDLNASGSVAFDANLVNGVQTCFVGTPGSLSLIAVANGAPYFSPSLLRLTSSGSAALRDARQYSQPFPDPAITKFLYYSGPVGGLSLLAQSGDAAPGTGGGVFDPQADSSSIPFLTGTDDYGFQSRIAGGNTGTAAFATLNGVLGRSFVALPAPATALANPKMLALTDTGAVVRSGNIDSVLGAEAILTGGPVPLPSELVAKVGDQVPGEAVGVVFQDLRDVTAEGNSLLFFATFSGGGSGLFVGTKASVASIAKIGSTVDGVANRTIQEFQSSKGFALLPSGDAVFVANLAEPDGSDAVALVRSDPSGLHSLLRAGSSKLPDYEVCRFIRDLRLVAVEGEKALILATPTSEIENGIYLLSPGGLTSIARLGQVIDLGSGSFAPISQITSPSFSPAARTGRDGRGTFLKGNNAAFTALVNPAPSTFQKVLLRASVLLPNACPADLNGDGIVEDSDFSIFVVAYNMLDCADPAMPPGCPADLNHDGVVEDADFSIFVVAYNDLLCP